MKTSHLLPEECKKEIRERVAYFKKKNPETFAIPILEWVLEDEKI
jgi:hypothetical protein